MSQFSFCRGHKIHVCHHCPAEAERLVGAGRGSSSSAYDALVQEIAASCMGDIRCACAIRCHNCADLTVSQLSRRHAVLQLQLSVVTASAKLSNRTSTAAPGLHRSQSLPAPPSSSSSTIKPHRKGTSTSRAEDNVGGEEGAIDLTANSTDDDKPLCRSTAAPQKALPKRTRTAKHTADSGSRHRTEHECVDLVDTESDADNVRSMHSKPDRKQQAVTRTGTRRSRTVVSESSDEDNSRSKSANVKNAVNGDAEKESLNANGKRSRGPGARQVIRGSSDGALNTTATAMRNGGTGPISAVISAEPLVPFPQQRNARVAAAQAVADSTSDGRGLGRRDSSYSSLRSVSKLLGAKLGKPGVRANASPRHILRCVYASLALQMQGAELNLTWTR
jgi:hypothetical protein